MPSSPNYTRKYGQEYANQGGTPKRKKARALNNAARKLAGGKVGDGKDVAHKDNNTKNKKKSNLVKQSPAKNRSFKRTKSAGRKK